MWKPGGGILGVVAHAERTDRLRHEHRGERNEQAGPDRLGRLGWASAGGGGEDFFATRSWATASVFRWWTPWTCSQDADKLSSLDLIVPVWTMGKITGTR